MTNEEKLVQAAKAVRLAQKEYFRTPRVQVEYKRAARIKMRNAETALFLLIPIDPMERSEVAKACYEMLEWQRAWISDSKNTKLEAVCKEAERNLDALLNPPVPKVQTELEL